MRNSADGHRKLAVRLLAFSLVALFAFLPLIVDSAASEYGSGTFALAPPATGQFRLREAEQESSPRAIPQEILDQLNQRNITPELIDELTKYIDILPSEYLTLLMEYGRVGGIPTNDSGANFTAGTHEQLGDALRGVDGERTIRLLNDIAGDVVISPGSGSGPVTLHFVGDGEKTIYGEIRIDGFGGRKLTLNFTGVTIDGRAPGGFSSSARRRGIVMSAGGARTNIEINGAVIQYCDAPGGGDGGGILLNGEGMGSATIRNSAVSYSKARDGGGIYSSGPLTLIDCAIEGNTARASGGGVFAVGSLVISGSSISGNSADISGGGLHLSQLGASIAGSGFIDNHAGRGGAIQLPIPFNFNNLVMDTVYFSGNTAGEIARPMDITNPAQLEMFGRTLRGVTFDRDRQSPEPAGREDVSSLVVNNIDITYSQADYEAPVAVVFLADIPGGSGRMDEPADGLMPEEFVYLEAFGQAVAFRLFSDENLLEKYTDSYEMMTGSLMRKDFHRWDGHWYLDPQLTLPVQLESQRFLEDAVLYPGWIDCSGESVTAIYVDGDGYPIPGFDPVDVVVGEPYGQAAQNYLGHIERAYGWASSDGEKILASDLVRQGGDHVLTLLQYPRDVSYGLRLPEGGRYIWADGYPENDRAVFLDHGVLPGGLEELYAVDTRTGRRNIGWHDGEGGYFVMGRSQVTFSLEELYPVFDEVRVSFETFTGGALFPDQYYPVLPDDDGYPSYRNGPEFPDASGLEREGHWLEDYGDGPVWYIDPEENLAVRHDNGSWAGLYPGNDDHTLYLKWISDQYNIAFVNDGGYWENGSASAKILPASHGSALPEPGELKRDGAEFIGWRDADQSRRYPGVDEVTASLTLYPVWAYAITFHTQGGLWENGSAEPYSPAPVKFGAPLPDPGVLRQTGQGLDCKAWKDAFGDEYIPGQTPVTDTLNLYPIWETSVHTVTFDPDGGKWKDDTSAPKQIEHSHEDNLRDPGAVEISDRIHDGGWQDKHGNIFIPGKTPVAESVTLKPRWKYTVTLHLNGGTWNDGADDPRKLYLLPGERVTIPEFGDKIGYVIDGWYQDGAFEWDFNQEVYGNVKLIAQWKDGKSAGHQVRLDPDGGVWTTLGHAGIHTFTVSDGSSAEMPPVARAGYLLTGWTLPDGTPWNSFSVIDADLALTARWESMLAVNFETAGGGAVEPVYVRTGYAYGRLPIPLKNGYSFDGWYTDEAGGDRVEDTTLVTLSDDHTIYARWNAHKLLIEFNWMDKANPMATNHSIRNAAAEYGKPFGALETAEPVHSDSTLNFIGWFTEPIGGDEIKAGDIVTDNTMVYAHWSQGQNKVIFEVDGANYLTVTRDAGQKLAEPEPPEAYNKRVFAGWYVGERKWSFHDEVTDDMILTARFIGETPPSGQLSISGNPRVELSVNDRRPYADRSIGWYDLLPLLGLVVTDDTGANVANQAEITPTNYHNINFDEVGEHILHYTAAVEGKTVNGTTLVAVADHTDPVIAVRSANIEIAAGRRPSLGYLMAKAGVSVTDNYDSEITVIPSFQNFDYKSIQWSRQGEYVMLLDAVDAAGNTADRRRVTVMVVSDGAEVDDQDIVNHGGDNWTGLDDSGNSRGLFHKTAKGDWVFIPDSTAPPTTLPNTGSKAALPAIAAAGLIAASLVLRVRGRKKEY